MSGFYTPIYKNIDKYPDKYPDFDSEYASIAFKRTFASNGGTYLLSFSPFPKKNKNAKITFSLNIYRELRVFCVPNAQNHLTI